MKEELIAALKKERELFKSRSMSTFEHDLAIKYLETGYKPVDYYDHELLQAAVDDYDTLCSDYLS
jgi:hypothetical protein